MTDFVEWLDSGNAPECFEDAYSLYQAAQGNGEWGPYKGVRDEQGRVFITGSNPPSLALVSDKAKAYFVRLIQRLYMDGDGPESMDPEGWYAFMHSMSKED